MKRFIALVLFAALAVLQLPAQAQSRVYNQAELDALLAPVALYPDPVLTDILTAATYPDELRDAAAWSRANPQLSGEAAVRAVDPVPWPPSVKALVAFPELLARMDESPQWTADLGAAFIIQEPQVMDTVQGLRRRAQASGYLQPNDQYSVQQQGQAIAVYPAQPQVVYVPYYDPYVVYGGWWWPAYRPVYWRPWHPRPAVFFSASLYGGRVDWPRRQITYAAPRRVVVQSAPAVVTIHNHANPAARPIVQGAQLPRQEFRREPRGEWREQRRDRIQTTQPVRPIVQQNFAQRQAPVRMEAPRASVGRGGGQPQRPGQHRDGGRHR